MAICLAIVAIALGVVLLILFRLSLRTSQLQAAVSSAAAARDRAQVLLSIAEAVNSSISLEEVLHVTVTQAGHMVGARAGAIYLLRSGQSELTREASFGLSPRARGHLRSPEREPMRGALEARSPFVQLLHEADAPGLEPHGHPKAAMVLPIARVGKLMGAMELYVDAPFEVSRELADLLQGITAQAATAIKHAQLYREQEESSLTDELTHLANRRYLAQRYLQEVQRARRTHRPMAVLMLDIDHFKEVNDTYGHLAGDEILARLGQILRNSIRDSDVCARYGGEEFAAILSDANLDGAMLLAGRLRAAVESAEFPHGRGITISIGVASSADPARLTSLLEAADAALYQAKHAGRNRVQPAFVDAAPAGS